MKVSSGFRILRDSLSRTVMSFPIIFCVICLGGLNSPRAQSPLSSSPALRIGEILNYRIDWRHFSGAATAQLQIVDRREFFGANSWHFRAALHTAAPLRAFYPLDDEIDSYALPDGLVSREYQERFREFGQPENTTAALVAAGQSSTSTLPRVIVPSQTRDALSAIYFLRLADWKAISELRTPIFDGQDVYTLIATREKSELVQIAAGNFTATKISIRLLDGPREIPDDHFTVWLANDPAQTPVLCEAYLPVGVLRIELISDSAWPGSANAKATPPAN
ncbi:MAG TPA: DUF3108 domain-containing protein [Verrucomicrobiae bacterium]|nr:DUF3108 domain-containing protein [Verrucomicrobiae bacterium]